MEIVPVDDRLLIETRLRRVILPLFILANAHIGCTTLTIRHIYGGLDWRVGRPFHRDNHSG